MIHKQLPFTDQSSTLQAVPSGNEFESNGDVTIEMDEVSTAVGSYTPHSSEFVKYSSMWTNNLTLCFLSGEVCNKAWMGCFFCVPITLIEWLTQNLSVESMGYTIFYNWM